MASFLHIVVTFISIWCVSWVLCKKLALIDYNNNYLASVIYIHSNQCLVHSSHCLATPYLLSCPLFATHCNSIVNQATNVHLSKVSLFPALEAYRPFGFDCNSNKRSHSLSSQSFAHFGFDCNSDQWSQVSCMTGSNVWIMSEKLGMEDDVQHHFYSTKIQVTST